MPPVSPRPTFRITIKKRLRYMLEAALAWLAYGCFRLLPFSTASACGGWIGRKTGPFLGVTRIARQNIKNALPHLSGDEIDRIILDMWENLGRVVGEFPHIPRLKGRLLHRHISVCGDQYLEESRKNGKGGILFSGHLANWELLPRVAAERGMPLVVVYRPPNNPWIDRLVRLSRRNSHAGMYAKGLAAAKEVFRALKKGHFVGMLVDQKMNEGVPVPFFRRDAMTAPAVAEMALKYDVPLFPARVIRVNSSHFKVIVSPPLALEGKSPEKIMLEINKLFEEWIREHPAQWFWVHKRWPK